MLKCKLFKRKMVFIMKHILNFLKGFLVGIANVIPGVSGGTLAIICGVYEKLISILSNIIKGVKENFLFLLFFILGAAIAIIVGSILIPLGLEKVPLITILFFAGLIVGGLPMLWQKIKGQKFSILNLLILLITFGLVIGLSFVTPNADSISFAHMNFTKIVLVFLVGIVAAATMIIPGISGSLVLMLLGYYEPILGAIKELVTFTNVGNNLLALIPFGIGCIVGIIFIAKLLKFLLNKFEVATYYGIIGFVLASIFSIFYKSASDIAKVFESLDMLVNIIHIVVGIILFALGTIFTYRLALIDTKTEIDI